MDYDLAGIRYEPPKKPKFERDFIMLSEFSELVGPVPVVSWKHSLEWELKSVVGACRDLQGLAEDLRFKVQCPKSQ